MADMLGDLGEVVTNRTLVLNVIRGLNEKFKTNDLHLRLGHPFPMFLEAKSDLQMEELTMENQAPSQQTALIASTDSSTSALRPPTAQQPHTGGSGSEGAPASSAPSSKSRRGKHGGKRDGSGQQTSGQHAAAGV